MSLPTVAALGLAIGLLVVRVIDAIDDKPGKSVAND